MTHRTVRPARFLLGSLLTAILLSLAGCYGYARYGPYYDQYAFYPYDYYPYGFYPYGFYPYGIFDSDHHHHGHWDHDHHGGGTRQDWYGGWSDGSRRQSRASTDGAHGSSSWGSGMVGGRSGRDGQPSTGSHGGLGDWGGSGLGHSSDGGRF